MPKVGMIHHKLQFERHALRFRTGRSAAGQRQASWPRRSQLCLLRPGPRRRTLRAPAPARVRPERWRAVPSGQLRRILQAVHHPPPAHSRRSPCQTPAPRRSLLTLRCFRRVHTAHSGSRCLVGCRRRGVLSANRRSATVPAAFISRRTGAIDGTAGRPVIPAEECCQPGPASQPVQSHGNMDSRIYRSF